MTEVASTGGGGVFLARERDCKTRKSSGGASRRRHAPLLDPVRRTTNAAGQLPPFVHSGCWPISYPLHFHAAISSFCSFSWNIGHQEHERGGLAPFYLLHRE